MVAALHSSFGFRGFRTGEQRQAVEAVLEGRDVFVMMPTGAGKSLCFQLPAIVRSQASEKDTKLAQKLGQLQPFMAVFLLECTGQLASFGPT